MRHFGWAQVPILNASFAPVFNTPAISSVMQNNFQAPFPSFTYEDLGLTFKAKPLVNGNSDVSLALEMEFRTLRGTVLKRRAGDFESRIQRQHQLVDGEPAVVAGAITSTENEPEWDSWAGSDSRDLNQVMTTNSKENDEDELLVVITPRVVSHEQKENAEVWMPK